MSFCLKLYIYMHACMYVFINLSNKFHYMCMHMSGNNAYVIKADRVDIENIKAQRRRSNWRSKVARSIKRVNIFVYVLCI